VGAGSVEADPADPSDDLVAANEARTCMPFWSICVAFFFERPMM
jgi:hypothetical protein